MASAWVMLKGERKRFCPGFTACRYRAAPRSVFPETTEASSPDVTSEGVER
jgi:hypothetical protein